MNSRTKKMKIAMIAKKDNYGLYSHVYHLIKELSRMQDINLHVINIVDDYNEETKIDRFGDFKIHYISQSRNKFGAIRGIYNVIKVIKKILEVDPEIIHFQSINYIIFANIPLMYRYSIVCTIHSLYSKDAKTLEWVSFSRHIYRKILSFLENLIVLRSLSNIIILAPQMRDLLEDKTNAKLYTIPNGIDLEDIQDIIPKSVDHPAILYVGRLTKIKGVDVLLKGIPLIKKVFPNILLYIMGTGDQHDQLKKLVKELNIDENVKFLGFISGKEKYSYYKSVDVCIVPSIDYDNAPVVLTEAMACGKPIIATAVGGISFMVEDGKTGLLVKPRDVEGLAEKIIILLQNESLREKLGKAGKEKIINFSWRVIAEQTADVYRTVLN